MNQQQFQQLKLEGYSDSEIAEAVSEVEKESTLNKGYQGAMRQNIDPRSLSQPSLFSYNPNDNLIKWQLELNEILERAEHILRSDKVEYKEGHQVWTKLAEEHPDRTLNDYGVQECLRILSMYLNRNTILGNYTEDEVNDKVFDFGDRLNTLFYIKYELMGMNTSEKRRNFEMLWGTMVDMVHSAYSRAIGGQERSSLREARQLQQVEQMGYGFQQQQQQGMNMTGMGAKTRSIFNPMRYVVGKYK